MSHHYSNAYTHQNSYHQSNNTRLQADMILPYPKKNSNSHSDWFFDPQLLASTSHLSSPVDMPYITPNVSVDNHFVRSPTQLDYQSNHISPEPYSGVPIFVSSVSHLPSPNSPQMVSPSHLNPMHMQYMGTSPVPSNNSYVLSPTPSHQYNTQIENSPSYYPEPFEYSSFNDFLNDISPVSFQSDIQTFESRYPIEEDNVSQCQKRHQNIDMLQSDEQNQTWTCPVEGCQKVYTRKYTLKMHYRTVHENEQNSKDASPKDLSMCPIEGCNRVYTREHTLKLHINSVHNNIRPFLCNHAGCKMAFSRRHDLVRHSTTHTGEKNYPCYSCSKSFARKEHLKSHQKSRKCLRNK